MLPFPMMMPHKTHIQSYKDNHTDQIISGPTDTQ